MAHFYVSINILKISIFSTIIITGEMPSKMELRVTKNTRQKPKTYSGLNNCIYPWIRCCAPGDPCIIKSVEEELVLSSVLLSFLLHC